MALRDKILELASNQADRDQMGHAIDEMKTSASDSRRSFERRWYDNNFFDDGYHFRYVSRETNKIVDLSEKGNIYTPLRAIPKASRQIRGIANLLVSPRYVPVIYPEKVVEANFTDPNAFLMAKQYSGLIAKKTGSYVLDEFKEQELLEKLAFMVILSCKHGVSYLEIWPDSIKEKINSKVYDAFDIYLMGSLTEIYDSPYIIKAVPRLVSEIKADENFDEAQTKKITPDNKLASSDIKQAYATAKFGTEHHNEASVTVIQNEAFVKEFINDDVEKRIKLQKNSDEILSGKDRGDMVIRQTFTAGNIWLSDEYISLKEYPFVDYRLEPGPIYQTPLMERFIPTNKSLDMAVSRLERFFHTMNVGVWMKRQGEQVSFTNQAGGQMVEYAQTPPVQANVTSPSAMSFPFLGFLSSLIEEQGVSTSALGRIPHGVRAGAAIEMLKESEYASLYIAQERLRQTVRRIAERILDYADKYYVTPKTVYNLEKGEPNYFDIIGASALKKRKELNIADGIGQSVVPVKGDLQVDIQVEEGLAFTSEGRKKRAKEVMDSLLPYVTAGLVPPDAFKLMMQTWLETWQYGAVSDIMAAMDTSSMTQQMSEDQLTQMKTAVLQALKDANEIGPAASQNRVMENKLGALAALKESGLAKNIQDTAQAIPATLPLPIPPRKSISFKDLPPEGKAQLAAQAGITLSAKSAALPVQPPGANTNIPSSVPDQSQTGGGFNGA